MHHHTVHGVWMQFLTAAAHVPKVTSRMNYSYIWLAGLYERKRATYGSAGEWVVSRLPLSVRALCITAPFTRFLRAVLVPLLLAVSLFSQHFTSNIFSLSHPSKRFCHLPFHSPYTSHSCITHIGAMHAAHVAAKARSHTVLGAFFSSVKKFISKIWKRWSRRDCVWRWQGQGILENP